MSATASATASATMDSSAIAVPKPTIGILSIGEMGSGIAKLLRAHDFPVVTVATGRSASTTSRIAALGISMLATDAELVSQADIILSMVPPRDAIATARRIAEACASPAGITARNARRGTSSAPLQVTYIDLNAVSPKTIVNISRILCPPSPPSPAPPSPTPSRPGADRRRPSFLTRLASATIMSSPPPQDGPPPDPIPIEFIDGAVIGPQPTQNPDTKEWTMPSIVICGGGPSSPSTSSPSTLSPALSTLLNLSHISPNLGAASTLKACYATLTKGLTALSILSLTTAASVTTTTTNIINNSNKNDTTTTTTITETPPQTLLPTLLKALSTHSPQTHSLVSTSLMQTVSRTSHQHNHHRHTEEMRQIGDTLSDVGGWTEASRVFDGLGDVSSLVAAAAATAAEEGTVETGSRGSRKKKTMTTTTTKKKKRGGGNNAEGSGGDGNGNGDGGFEDGVVGLESAIRKRRRTRGGGGGGGRKKGFGGAGDSGGAAGDLSEEDLSLTWRGSWT